MKARPRPKKTRGKMAFFMEILDFGSGVCYDDVNSVFYLRFVSYVNVFFFFFFFFLL